MEGLGIAASLIAVIQLTGQVTSLSYGYISKVGQAQEGIKSFVDELNSLRKFLELIDNYVKNGSANSDALQALAEPLRACKLQLENLESKLRPKKPPSWLRKKMRLTSLAWPFKEKEVLEIIIKIERNKTSFLLALSLDNISQLQANSLAQSSWRQADDSAREEEIRKKALHWLYSEDFDKIHTEIGSLRQKDTGGWLLESPSFRKLVEAEQGSRLLWGYGIPGAGKTFLSFAVADHFLSQARQKGYGVAYFYFNYNEEEQQRPATVLSCLLKQLASQLAHLPKGILELYELEKKNIRPTFSQLVDVLLETFEFFSQVFLVFDALDECDEESQRRELLPLFHKLADTGASLFVTSRQYPEDIQESFKEVSRIELSAKSDDIKNYIEERIDKNPRAKRLVHEGKLKDSIISQLTESANGMFLAVRFHVQYLCHQTTLNQIRAALETLKNHVVGEKLLDPTYDRVTETIQNQPKSCADLAVRVLSWLVHAKRVLTVKEIQIAVSIEPGRYELEDSDLPDIKTLVDVCFGLVTVDENSDTVRLSHLTVHEYLKRHPIIPKDANLDIAIACTTYNSFNILAELAPHEFLGKQSLWETRLALYPFIKYSALFMSSHLSSCKEESTQNTVLQFLTRSANLNFWVLCIYYLEINEWYYVNNRVFSDDDNGIPFGWPFSKSYSRDWAPLEGASRIGHFLLVQRLVREGCTSPIAVRLAASEGHEDVVRFLVENGADLSIPDHAGDLPLHLAAMKGFEEVIKVLLDRGVDIDGKGSYGMTALHYAARNGREAVVKLLLDRGADTEAKGNWGGTALHCAVGCGHEAVVKLLLDRGADIGAKENRRETALHYAAGNGHEAVVKLLLDRGADIGAKENSRETALHYAARIGHEAVVELLLDRGADIEAKSDSGETALHCAAGNGHEAVVKLLLDRGAGTEAKGNDGETALHYAANGHEAIVKLLLDRGADIEAKNNDGDTALHCAAEEEGHEAVVKLLLDRGADIGAKNDGGKTLLHCAAEDGYEAVVELLLDRGADIGAKSNSGETALHCAARGWREAVVELLLDRGADIGAKNDKGGTALHYAVENGDEAVVKLLLDRGADIEAIEGMYGALHYAAEWGLEEAVKLLLDRGADIGAENNSGETALHCAARGGREAVKLLLDRGADIEAKGNDGETALHCAAQNGHEAVAELLLDRGADIGTENNSGETALHRAAEEGHEAVVKLLLDRGADIGAKNDRGETALHRVAERWHEEVVELLLDRGADTGAKNYGGETALHCAAKYGREEVVKLLLDRGADIEAKNDRGETALHYAAEGGREDTYTYPPIQREELVELLLDRGADIEAKNNDGETALHCAARDGQEEVIELLLDRGAKE